MTPNRSKCLVLAVLAAAAAARAQPRLPPCTSCDDCGPSRYAVAGDVPGADGLLPLRRIPVVIHEVRDPGEPKRITKGFVDETMQLVNAVFESNPGRLKFGVCKIEVTTNADLAALTWAISEDKLCNPNDRRDAFIISIMERYPWAVNVLYVPSMGVEVAQASFPSGAECIARFGCQVVMLAKNPPAAITVDPSFSPFARDPSTNALTGWSTLAHELGHYFGLYHTFEGGGQSLACGTGRQSCFGCELPRLDAATTGNWVSDNGWCTGDLICDTPADRAVESLYGNCAQEPMQVVPGGNGFANNVGCIESAPRRLFNPLRNNLMNGWFPRCRTSLTPTQLARARWFALTQRSQLSTACVQPRPGDLNSDGRIDSADVLDWLTAYFAGDAAAADVNGDGVLNSADLSRIVALLQQGLR